MSGGGILKNAPNKANAIKFLEFLLSEKAQTHIVDNTFEYPVLDTVMPNSLIAQFGTDFKIDNTSVADFLNPASSAFINDNFISPFVAEMPMYPSSLPLPTLK